LFRGSRPGTIRTTVRASHEDIARAEAAREGGDVDRVDARRSRAPGGERRMLFEPLEPRVLLSADLNPSADSLLSDAAQASQPGETLLLLDEKPAPSVDTSMLPVLDKHSTADPEFTAGFAVASDGWISGGFVVEKDLVVREWDGGGNGTSWSDAANWVGNVLPGAGEQAVVGAGHNVSFNTTATVGALLSASPITVQGGTLTVVGAAQFDGGLVVSGGTVNLGGASTAASLALNGTIDGAGDLTVAGAFTWTAGTLGGVGVLTTQGAATWHGGTTGRRCRGRGRWRGR
jgi:hypothetical protein